MYMHVQHRLTKPSHNCNYAYWSDYLLNSANDVQPLHSAYCPPGPMKKLLHNKSVSVSLQLITATTQNVLHFTIAFGGGAWKSVECFVFA